MGASIGPRKFLAYWRDTILTAVLLAAVLGVVEVKDGGTAAADTATVVAIFAIEVWVVLSFGRAVFGRRTGGRLPVGPVSGLGLLLVCALHWWDWNYFWAISRYVLPSACVLLAMVLVLDHSSS